MTENHDYNTPGRGTENWGEALNENFRSLDRDVTVRDTESSRTTYEPQDGALFVATDTGRQFVGDGDRWREVPTSVPVVDADPNSPAVGQLWLNRAEGVLRLQAPSGTADLWSSDSGSGGGGPLEDFESQSLSAYRGDVDGFEVTEDAIADAASLRGTGADAAIASTTVETPRGREYRCRFVPGTESYQQFLVNVQRPGQPKAACYAVFVGNEWEDVALQERQGDNRTDLVSADYRFTPGTEYVVGIASTADRVWATLYDADGTRLARTPSMQSNTHTGGTLGFGVGTATGVRWDHVTGRAAGTAPPVDDDPSDSPGDGDGDDGATKGQPPMHGVWPHGWYYSNDTPRTGRAAIEPVIEELGAPQIVGNTTSTNSQKVSKFRLERVMPTADTPWDHMYVVLSMVDNEYVRNEFSGSKEEKTRQALEEVAAGQHDDTYRTLARNARELGIEEQLVLRVAPEYNGVGKGGGWQPDAAVGHPDVWKRAFRRTAAVIWDEAPEILVGISPSVGHSLDIVERSWPGEEYVDYLAVSGPHDEGYGTGYDSEQQLTGEDCDFPNCSRQANDEVFQHAWNYYKTTEFGLDTVAEYSETYDLPIGFPEWGLVMDDNSPAPGRDNPRFIRAMWKWMNEHDVHWQTYFEAKWFGGSFLDDPAVPNSLGVWNNTFRAGSPTDHIAQYRESIDYSNRP